MVPRRVLRPLLVALVSLLALAPSAGRPLPALAASVTFTVTSPADRHDATPGDGVCADNATHCTLRAAVEEANAQPSGSTITITIPAGTYALSLGTLALTRNTITLAGAGSSTTVIDGRGSRVLAVAATAFAKISGVTLRNGNAGNSAGGALANLGLTVLSDSAVVSNTATDGGGILNQGTLIVSRSRFSRNSAEVGGAIASTGTLTVTNSSLTINTSTAVFGSEIGGGGGGIDTSGVATVSHSLFYGNTTTFGGGGVLNSGTLTVTASTFRRNSAAYSGGGIANIGKLRLPNGTILTGRLLVTTSTFSNNSSSQGDGGGIDSEGLLTIASSTLSHNAASDGGGIGNTGPLTILTSTLSHNSALGGGGIENSGPLTVTNSTLSDNSAEVLGGGIESDGLLTMTNSTLSGNVATQSGGGIENEFTSAVLLYVTVASNSSGIINETSFGHATMTLTGTIIANSTRGPNCSGPISESGGYNLDSGTSCGFSQTTDLTNTNPLLSFLANYGGPTPTMALLPTSPAIDHGGTSATGCPATDQRGVVRPQGRACDIGAFEARTSAG